MAVSWPALAEVKQYLDVGSDDFDGTADNTRLTRALAAAIQRVKLDVGWIPATDVLTEQLAQAAFRAAVVIASSDEGMTSLDHDERYQELLKGYRRSFGIA
jgi:hypothetical protein